MVKMAIKIVHCLIEPFDVYIGRKYYDRDGKRVLFQASKWANPFQIGRHGTREEVIKRYHDYLYSNDNPDLLAAIRNGELKGKTLGCWCKTPKHPDTPCHGDVLKELSEMYCPEE